MTRPAVLEDLGWAERVDHLIDLYAASGRPFTADYLHTPETANPPHDNAWGPRLNTAAHAGLIRITGYTPSTRPGRNRSLIRVWTGTGATRQDNAA